MNKSHVYRTPFIVGLPVPTKQFFGRREQVRQFYGQCVLGPVLQPTRILGMKRSGKTSFMNYIADIDIRNSFLNKTDFSSTKFIYINAQEIHSPYEFYNTVASAISEQWTTSRRNLLELRTGRAFKKWLENAFRTGVDLKVIVLIDEFEKLHETQEFDAEFFGLLRAIASALPSSLTWVTASAVDLYTLDKSQKTSPFWNIFHQMPIIMGGLDSDAQSLINDSLKAVGETMIESEMDDIIALSGKIPYFIQAVADAWYNLREKQEVSLEKIKDIVFDMLSNPNNQIQHVYKDYWNEMGQRRRAILKNIASERRDLTAAYSDLVTLSDFGLIISDDNKYGGYKISGQLLKQFIIDANENISTLVNSLKEAENKIHSQVVVVEVEKETHIHTEGGNYIHGNLDTGGGNVIRDDNKKLGMSTTDITNLFESLYHKINSRTDLKDNDKADLIAEIDDLKKELAKKESPDENFLMHKLRNIFRMAPDIFEVTLATITNPIAGFGIIAKKVAEKARATAG